MSNARLRLIPLGVAAAEALFWLYATDYIDSHAIPRGDGSEWMAMIVPITTIFLCGVLPALILGVLGYWFSLAAKIAAAFAAVTLVADVIVWTHILAEFARKAAH
jgi:hypothetical protein